MKSCLHVHVYDISIMADADDSGTYMEMKHVFCPVFEQKFSYFLIYVKGMSRFEYHLNLSSQICNGKGIKTEASYSPPAGTDH